ncbi:hypothetical protein [uncultured Desulfobacter sp.]|uniref:hypothetical protein n=1 Tax=uncultured Desulfobacter sp. TaxID=240139 RepID=UPI002AA65EE1|nr:hypothetical protein [uncultured Desulfobacter sp.]
MAILRRLGMPMTYLGGVYLLGVFWVLKFLWAPLVDRLGTCHDWILVTQSGMGNGIQAAGGLLGHLIGGGVVLLLYPSIGWQGCMSLLAICTAGSLVTVFLFKSAAVAIPSCNCSRGVTLRRRLRFWKTPGHGNWLVILSTLMMDYASRESPATDYALQFGLFWL